jgi:hypothetical protein
MWRRFQCLGCDNPRVSCERFSARAEARRLRLPGALDHLADECLNSMITFSQQCRRITQNGVVGADLCVRPAASSAQHDDCTRVGYLAAEFAGLHRFYEQRVGY